MVWSDWRIISEKPTPEQQKRYDASKAPRPKAIKLADVGEEKMELTGRENLSAKHKEIPVMRERQKESEELFPEIGRMGAEYGQMYTLLSKLNIIRGRAESAVGYEEELEEKMDAFEKMNMRQALEAEKNLKHVINETYGKLDSAQKKNFLSSLSPAEQSKLAELQMTALEEDIKKQDDVALKNVRENIKNLAD